MGAKILGRLRALRGSFGTAQGVGRNVHGRQQGRVGKVAVPRRRLHLRVPEELADHIDRLAGLNDIAVGVHVRAVRHEDDGAIAAALQHHDQLKATAVLLDFLPQSAAIERAQLASNCLVDIGPDTLGCDDDEEHDFIRRVLVQLAQPLLLKAGDLRLGPVGTDRL